MTINAPRAMDDDDDYCGDPIGLDWILRCESYVRREWNVLLFRSGLDNCVAPIGPRSLARSHAQHARNKAKPREGEICAPR